MGSPHLWECKSNEHTERGFGGIAVNNQVGWTSLLLVVSLVGCAPQTGPRASTSVLLEDQTKVKVDDQGNSQVSGAPAPQAPVGEAK